MAVTFIPVGKVMVPIHHRSGAVEIPAGSVFEMKVFVLALMLSAIIGAIIPLFFDLDTDDKVLFSMLGFLTCPTVVLVIGCFIEGMRYVLS